MDILNWINSHGVVMMMGWGVIILVASTIPPLPEGAGWWQIWAYRIIKGVALNAKSVSRSFGYDMPQIEIPGAKKLRQQNSVNKE